MHRVVAAVRRVLVVPEPDLVHRSRASLVVAVGTGLGILALLLTPVVTVLPYAAATVVTLLAASALSFTAALVARRGHLDVATAILIVQLLGVLVVPSVHGRDGTVVAALSASGPSYRFSRKRIGEVIDLLRGAADQLSTQLGYLDAP